MQKEAEVNVEEETQDYTQSRLEMSCSKTTKTFVLLDNSNTFIRLSMISY